MSVDLHNRSDQEGHAPPPERSRAKPYREPSDPRRSCSGPKAEAPRRAPQAGEPLLLKLPQVRVTLHVGVPITLRELGRRSGVLRVVLGEDIEGDFRIRDERKTADTAHLGVDDRVTNPIEIFADIHLHAALLDEAENERGAVERVDAHASLRSGDRYRRNHELAHAVI